ncbi:protein kinase [Kitasatospora sp. NPDC101176]|uniref:serine/threonine-protein kinase n=1 Tax=Kitasatospora sp. NPDC101176 TaxID=3364099 RepID=UPI00380C606A
MNTAGAEQRLVDGRFELLQQLGGGGMGVVWRARDNALHREVVLKEVRPPDPAMAAADPDAARELRERVLREARALARLQHPNVVVIHHIVDTPEHPHPWLVMELVSGGSLADRLAHGPLGTAEAARIGRGVLSALRAAHLVGIQHRDVKPANVLLRPDGTPVLADFGIAAIQDATALTATGALIGSPEYIAPERIRGQEGNPSSDLWSLGMLLYVAVEGSHPLRRATTLATLAAVLDEPLPPPVRAGRLGPLLSALLGKDPALRPDAEQLDRALAAAEYEAAHGAGEGAPYPTGTVRLGAGQPAPPATGPFATGPITGPSAGGSFGTGPFGTGPFAGGPSDSGSFAGRPFAPPADRVPTGFQAPATLPTGPGHPEPAGTRKARRRVLTLTAAAVLLAGGGSALYLSQGDASTGRTPTAGTTPSATVAAPPASAAPASTTAPGATPDQTAPASTAATPAAQPSGKVNLLTPDGVRRTVAALQPYAAGGKVYKLVVYPEYATAEVAAAAGGKLYDDITIRDGKATRSPGGTLIGDTKPVDLGLYNWDVIPTLLQRAQDTLNVPKPTMRYLMIDPDMFDGTPSIKVYLADDYGTGYLETDPKGVNRRSYPRAG